MAIFNSYFDITRGYVWCLLVPIQPIQLLLPGNLARQGVLGSQQGVPPLDPRRGICGRHCWRLGGWHGRLGRRGVMGKWCSITLECMEHDLQSTLTTLLIYIYILYYIILYIYIIINIIIIDYVWFIYLLSLLLSFILYYYYLCDY